MPTLLDPLIYLFIFTNELGLIYSKILQIGHRDFYPCLAFFEASSFLVKNYA